MSLLYYKYIIIQSQKVYYHSVSFLDIRSSLLVQKWIIVVSPESGGGFWLLSTAWDTTHSHANPTRSPSGRWKNSTRCPPGATAHPTNPLPGSAQSRSAWAQYAAASRIKSNSAPNRSQALYRWMQRTRVWSPWSGPE